MRRFISVTMLVIIVLLAVLVWFYPSIGDFRTDNHTWNGAREFSEDFGADMLSSLTDLPEVPGNYVLILIPYESFSTGDLAAIDRFVSDGGVLLLADDYGYGNAVLEYLKIDAGFSGEQLLDPLFNYKSSSFPKVVDFTSTDFTEGVENIILNHATSLDIGSGAELIAQSSASSFLDLNDNQTLDDNEETGPLPVAAQYHHNRGLVVLFSDPSLIINCMYEAGDNHTFIDNIMRYNSPEPHIMLDQSHLPGDNLHEAKSGLGTMRDALATPLGIAFVVTVVITLALFPIWLRVKGGKNDGSDENKRRAGKDTR